MKRLFLIIFFLAMSLSCSGFTFMVHTVEDQALSDLPEEEQEAIAALENGFMDVLFEDGHIIFSMFCVDNPSRSPISGTSDSQADFIVELNLGYDSRELQYSVYRVSTGQLVYDEAVQLDDLLYDETPDSERDYFYMSGKFVAQLVYARVM
jgi:hypothetical protein